jgi:hypothetical protein
MIKKLITKESIIEYLKNYYEKYKEIPKTTNKDHPFCYKTVSNKFGSWNNALFLANIPLRMNKPVDVKCKQCNILFKKHIKEIKKIK